MQSRIDPHLLAKHASNCIVPAKIGEDVLLGDGGQVFVGLVDVVRDLLSINLPHPSIHSDVFNESTETPPHNSVVLLRPTDHEFLMEELVHHLTQQSLSKDRPLVFKVERHHVG
jgi:hypothetical protein